MPSMRSARPSPSRRPRPSASSPPRKAHGLRVKLHAEQLSDQHGAALAAKYDALSADHLEHLERRGHRRDGAAPARSRCCCRCAFYFLRETKKPPVAALRARRCADRRRDRLQSRHLARRLAADGAQHGLHAVRPDAGGGAGRHDAQRRQARSASRTRSARSRPAKSADLADLADFRSVRARLLDRRRSARATATVEGRSDKETSIMSDIKNTRVIRARAGRRSPASNWGARSGDAHADEQSRSRGRRAAAGPRRLWRHRQGGAQLDRLRPHRRDAEDARGGRDAARAVGQAGRRVPHARGRAARADRQFQSRAANGPTGSISTSSIARA